MLDSLIQAMKAAIEELRRWPEQTIQVFHHNDADGLTSGAILTRALERQGYKVQRFCLEKPYPAVLRKVYEQEGRILNFADFAGRSAPLLSDLNDSPSPRRRTTRPRFTSTRRALPSSTRTSIMLGVTYVKENGGEFTGTAPLGAGPETQKDLNFFIPNMYYTYTNKARGWAFGVGVFAPFGLGQEYQNADTSIIRNQVTKIDLQTIVINPTFAFDINEAISVGMGIDYMWGKVDYEKTPYVPPALAVPANFMRTSKGPATPGGTTSESS